MSIKILMPALSPTMTEGNLSKWLVKEGDSVKAGDVIAEIETDKATMEVEAVDEGVVTNLIFKEGDSSIPVNSTIAILNGDKNDEIKKIDEIEQSKKENTLNTGNKVDKINQENIKKFQNKKNFENVIKASPYSRSVAKEKGIDLSKISGSGPDGRIIKKDLDTSKLENFSKNDDENIGKLPSLIRKIIADRTTLTKQTVPHYYLTIESNVDKLIKLRKKINDSTNNKISINDILVKALAYAQSKNPATNVIWKEDKILQNNTVDVSIAVALDEGLVTPILKNANNKGLIEISDEIKELVKKAKKGKLLPDEYNGGTISISNLGMFGISEFAAIINPPQSCILAVGAIKQVAGVIDNEIKIINTIKSTLSADHRVLDGAVAGKLLKDFNDILEDPFSLWLISEDLEIL